MSIPAYNRRSEARHYCFGEKLAWREDGSNYKRRHGWLNDISPSGVSFLVEARKSPSVGEKLEMTRDIHGQPTLCRVVRTDPIDAKLTLIGCRRDAAGGSARGWGPSPTLAMGQVA